MDCLHYYCWASVYSHCKSEGSQSRNERRPHPPPLITISVSVIPRKGCLLVCFRFCLIFIHVVVIICSQFLLVSPYKISRATKHKLHHFSLDAMGTPEPRYWGYPNPGLTIRSFCFLSGNDRDARACFQCEYHAGVLCLCMPHSNSESIQNMALNKGLYSRLETG